MAMGVIMPRFFEGAVGLKRLFRLGGLNFLVECAYRLLEEQLHPLLAIVRIDSLGPSAAARRRFLGKLGLLLAFAQDDGGFFDRCFFFFCERNGTRRSGWPR